MRAGRPAPAARALTSHNHLLAAPTPADPLRATNTGYPQLEVFDSSELQALQGLLKQERVRVEETRLAAKEGQRKVLRVNCDLDLKRIDRLSAWAETVQQDARRTW